MKFIAILLLALGAVTPQAALAEENSYFVPGDAAGVFLAKVIHIDPSDKRAGDGSVEEYVELQILKSSGRVVNTLRILSKPAENADSAQEKRDALRRLPIRPGVLAVGKQYWFASASEDAFELYPQGIISCFPVGFKEIDEAFEKAMLEGFPG